MSLYIIQITDEMQRAAKHYEDAINKTKTLSRTSNMTGLEEAGRFYFGFLGELIFEAALKRENKEYQHFVRTDGLPQTYKFRVIKDETNQEVRLNICTASKPSHKFLAVPEPKIHRAECDGYVGIKILENGYAQIFGYITPKELRDCGASAFPGKSVAAFRCELESLKPIENLFPKLRAIKK